MATSFTRLFDSVVRQIVVECSVSLPECQDAYVDYRKALWDTGANITCISNRLADILHLNALDEVLISFANNDVFKANTYYVQLKMGRFVLPFIKVLGLPMDESKDIIIGMDVISKGDLAVTNYEGKTVLSFREPSSGRIIFAD